VSRLKAVLFDMDGTLVDSEKVWSIGLDELAQAYGGTLSATARAAMIGTSMAESMAILHADLRQPWRDEAVSVSALENRVKELFDGHLVWRPGARELLAQVRAAGIPTALVTATRRHLVEVALRTIGADNFDAIVCGDDIVDTKPDPAPYLAAAAALAAPIGGCIAIEDSPTGVASAVAAGAKVIAVPSEVDLSHLASVTHLDSLVGLGVADLEALLR
jgi:HAD superfamily hydrolase (TIGR01509 family)